MEKRTKATILIVEDDPFFRTMYRNLIESEGYRVLEAEDGESGFKLAQSKIPDLVISDLALPKMDGLELIQKLHMSDLTKHIPFILSTASQEQERIEKVMALGANDYVIKAVSSTKELIAKIQKLLTSSSKS